MFFSTSKKIGQELAGLALSLGDVDAVRNFMSTNAFTPVQCQRFQWGVGIVNMVTAVSLVKTSVQDRDQAGAIINSMYTTYRSAIRDIRLKIGDFVILEEERTFLRAQMMSLSKEYVGNVADTETNAVTLTDLLYERRQQQYLSDLGEGLKEALSADERISRHTLGPMFHVARRFAAHFAGNDDDASLVVGLSLLFGQFLTVLMNHYDETVGK